MTISRFGRLLAAAFVLTATIGASSACATPRGRVFVRVAPPAPIVEARIVAPGPGFVWVDGFHRWNGAAYAWVPGRWERAPRAGCGCRADGCAKGGVAGISSTDTGDEKPELFSPWRSAESCRIRQIR